MGEMMLGRPMFAGNSATDQLVEIIRILGTPNEKQRRAMNPDGDCLYGIPSLNPIPYAKVFEHRLHSLESLDLLSKFLDYTPEYRLSAIESLIHPFFDEIRRPEVRLPSGRDLPLLFNFSEHGKFMIRSLIL
jgi:glycogen synthase kinase 3 beta